MLAENLYKREFSDVKYYQKHFKRIAQTQMATATSTARFGHQDVSNRFL